MQTSFQYVLCLIMYCYIILLRFFVSTDFTLDTNNQQQMYYKTFYWSFVEMTSVKQDPKPHVGSNFQMSFLLLSQTYPLVEASQVSLTFGQPVGHADLQVTCPPRCISGQLDIWSAWVRLTFSQIDPPVEASCGQEWYYIRSA